MPSFMGSDLGGLLSTIGDGMGDLFGQRQEVPQGLSRLAFGQQQPLAADRVQYGQTGMGSVWDNVRYGATGLGGSVWDSLQYGGERSWDLMGFGNGGVGPGLSGIERLIGMGTQQQRADAANGATTHRDLSPQGADGSYGNHEAYRTLIQQAATKYGIDPDALAAILQIESPTGDPNVTSSAGAQGLAQFMPDTWAAYGGGGNPFDSHDAIYAAAYYYATLYKQFGNSYALAAAAYNGGPGSIVNGVPRDSGGDGNVTPKGYMDLWVQKYNAIKSTAPKPQPSQGLGSVTPGTSGTIMQEFGSTPYAQAHPDVYTYGTAYGMGPGQHPGVDWAVPIGSKVATPMGGTVFVVGNDHGTGYYYTNTMTGSDPDHSGEFAVMLDNGDILILGHLSSITAQVGQRVSAGEFIGLSGGSDGAHVHVEYRRRNSNGGYTIVDPRQYLGGAPTPGGGGGATRS